MNWKTLGRSVSVAIVLLCAAMAFAQVPLSQHVVLVIDENSSFSSVMSDMPWLVSQGNEHGYATNYESNNGGSLLDYLWLASGSCESSANCALPAATHNFNCNGNDCYYPGTTTPDAITDNNIFRLMNNAHISWKVYAQSYAAAGGTPRTPDNNNGTHYYRRHNGATWYSDILNNVSGSAGKIVDFSQLSIDLANNTLPRFMIIVPDGAHDAHDCPLGMSSCTEAQQLAAADQFLSETLGPILSKPAFQPGGTGVIFVTFDECGGGTNAGCNAAVYTALLGPRVRPHSVSNIPYKHENLLRTILDSLGLHSYPGAAAMAADMADFFTSDGSRPDVVINSPGNGASLVSPVALEAAGYPTSGHSIVGWWVYVDSVGKYNAGALPTIGPKISMGTGTHTVVVRAWDSSGAYGDQAFTLNVQAPHPAVTVRTPTNSSNVGSPVNIQASALATSGHSMSKWSIYVDGNTAYTAGASASINPNVHMGLGSHTVIVRAWDTSGAYGDRTLSLTIASKPGVVVSTPLVEASVVSPIHIQASATPSSGRGIAGWWIYVDSVAKFHAGAVDSITANIAAAAGTHTVVVRAWDTADAYGDQTFAVEVKP